MARNLFETIVDYLSSRSAARFIAVAIALVLSWQVVALTNNAVQLSMQPTYTTPKLYQAPEFKDNFFGDATWGWASHSQLYEEIPPEPVKPVAPSIKLDVTLLGILNSGPTGFAMMKVNKGAEKLYKLGDTVQGNIKVEKIEINSVTLSDGTTEREYNMHKQESNIFLQAAPVPTPTVQAPAAQPVASAAPSRPARNVAIPSLPPRSRQRFTRLENRITENPLAASNDVDARPVSRNGQVYGYRVNYRVDPALLRSIGLLPTDIIISVNGIAAATIASDSNLVASLMTEKNFTIVYDRNGATNTLNISR